MSFSQFCGAPHLDMLREHLRDEEARVAEWRHRDGCGKVHAHRRGQIRIA
jgi:hypothetical protein